MPRGAGQGDGVRLKTACWVLSTFGTVSAYRYEALSSVFGLEEEEKEEGEEERRHVYFSPASSYLLSGHGE